jgi:hypothetical protein
MTALINAVTVTSLSNSLVGNTLNIITILIFLCIMIAQEILRAIGDERADGLIRIMNSAAYPLLIVFITLIALRFGIIFVLNVHPPTQ